MYMYLYMSCLWDSIFWSAGPLSRGFLRALKKHKNFIDLFIRNGLLGLFLNQVMTIFLTVKPIDDIESLQYFPFYFHKIILLPEFFIEGIEEIH